MKLVENIIHAIRPARPAVEYFDGNGGGRDATAELKRCFEGPIKVDPSKLPIEFAGRVQKVFGATAATDNLQALEPRELTPTTEGSQPDTYASLDSLLGEPLVTHHPARTT